MLTRIESYKINKIYVFPYIQDMVTSAPGTLIPQITLWWLLPLYQDVKRNANRELRLAKNIYDNVTVNQWVNWNTSLLRLAWHFNHYTSRFQITSDGNFWKWEIIKGILWQARGPNGISNGVRGIVLKVRNKNRLMSDQMLAVDLVPSQEKEYFR